MNRTLSRLGVTAAAYVGWAVTAGAAALAAGSAAAPWVAAVIPVSPGTAFAGVVAVLVLAAGTAGPAVVNRVTRGQDGDDPADRDCL